MDRSLGSPPLTRGKPIPLVFSIAFIRITPAHAGKTGLLQHSLNVYEDHPRSRGENLIPATNVAIGKGSPPLTRGKLFVVCSAGLPQRITPAHAGKTLLRSTTPFQTWDHPRSRGENYQTGRTAGTLTGSPPLTRGKLNNAAYCVRGARITPAHAGKTGFHCVIGRLY